MSYLDNDSLFREQITEGFFWETYVGVFLQHNGLPVIVSPQSIRADVRDRGAWKDRISLDLKGTGIEVKSRGLVFHSRDDFPYKTAFVDECNALYRARQIPAFYIFVSQNTGAMVGLDVRESLTAWKERSSRDRVRGESYKFFEVDKSYLLNVEMLIERLRWPSIRWPNGDRRPSPG